MDSEAWNIMIALATCGAAVAAWMSARSTERAARGQLLFHFLNEYSDEEMRNSLRVLGENKGDVEKNKMPPHDERLNSARRYVKHFFFKSQTLKNTKIVDAKFVEEICKNAGFDLLFEVIEPLEKSLGLIGEQDKVTYDNLRKYYRKSGSE